jgi:hypothetical protein
MPESDVAFHLCGTWCLTITHPSLLVHHESALSTYISCWPFYPSMDSSQQDISPLSPPASSQSASTSFIPQSSYLTVPSTKPSGSILSLPGPTAFEENDPELLVPQLNKAPTLSPILQTSEPIRSNFTSNHRLSPFLEQDFASFPDPIYMSVYSSTSTSSEHSTYSNPPARIYRVPSFQKMSGSRKISVVLLHFLIRKIFENTSMLTSDRSRKIK